MVQLPQRRPGSPDPRVHTDPQAFTQLFAGTYDLRMSSDPFRFEHSGPGPASPTQGPKLHFDLESFVTPVTPFLQGILYLTDTAANPRRVAGRARFSAADRRLARVAAGGARPDPRGLERSARSDRRRRRRSDIWTPACSMARPPTRVRAPRLVPYLTMYPAPRPGSIVTVTFSSLATSDRSRAAGTARGQRVGARIPAR